MPPRQEAWGYHELYFGIQQNIAWVLLLRRSELKYGTGLLSFDILDSSRIWVLIFIYRTRSKEVLDALGTSEDVLWICALKTYRVKLHGVLWHLLEQYTPLQLLSRERWIMCEHQDNQHCRQISYLKWGQVTADRTYLRFIMWEDALLLCLGTFLSCCNSTMKICRGLC